MISEEATRLNYLLQSERLTQYDKAKFVRLTEGAQGSLKLLTSLLYKHCGIPIYIHIAAIQEKKQLKKYLP